MMHEQILPDIEAAGYVRLAIGLELKASGEQHHVGVRSEHRTCWPRGCYSAADSHVEPLHARRLGKVVLRRAIHPREGVKKACHPAVILADQLLEKRPALIGR